MDNATRKELLYRARAAGYPGSILDVYANYDQGKDLVAEFQAQQRHQQMSGIAAQQSGLQQAAQQGGQQPQIDMQPQPVAMPAIPSPNFTPPQPPQPIGIQSQDTPVGIVSGQSGPNQGRAIFATGGFTNDPPDWRSILDYKNAAPAPKQNLVGDVRKVARPTAVAESTNRNVTHQIPANTKELKAEKDAQAAYDALPEAMKRRDTLSANNTSSTQKAINQAYYALSNPAEALGHAMKYGYVPQGNLGNYGIRQDGDAFSDVSQFANPMFYANAAYRLGEDASQKNSWTTKEGLINMGADALEAAPIAKPLGMAMTSAARMSAGPLIRSTGEFLTTQTPLKNAYKYNPWAFKPNPEAYYHRSPNLENIINQEKGTLQGFSQSKAGEIFNETAGPGRGHTILRDGTVSRINLKKPANSSLYFSKGVPLDYGRYNPETFNEAGKRIMTGQGYPGPYMVEVEGVPKGASTKGAAPGLEPKRLESYAVSKRPIGLDEAKFYKEDWLRGYKKIKKETGGFKEKKCYTCVGRKRRV